MNILNVLKPENINKVYNVYHGKRKLGKWTLERIIYTDDLTLEFKNEEGKYMCDKYFTGMIVNMDFEEVAPQTIIDWSKVKTDTQVLVSDDCENWVNRHFAKYDKEKNKFYTWKDGKTSFTTDLKEEWEYWDTID